LNSGQEVGLGNTHEEALAAAMVNHLQSYKDLPAYLYQFQTKFRNELRAKSGLLRTREFIMKDLYSFSRDAAEHERFYEMAKQAYRRVFERLGLGEQTYLTFASGGSFSKFSHEFQTICETGEDTVYVSRAKRLAVNAEVLNDEVLAELKLSRDELEEAKAAEVGNIFSLGTKYSEAIGLKFSDEHGRSQPVVMGSYGIGPARVMAVITELMADERGLVWPAAIAPFEYHLISLGEGEISKQAEAVYNRLSEAGLGVLWDDRSERAGAKLADADLLGLPVRLIVSDKTGERVEYKKRSADETKLLDIEQLLAGE
jgi:prolyl-tRNA synthetase